MSKAPSMPMFWDAYLADTTHLSAEEHGAYLLLLAAMWRRNGWVPDDDRDNARILGLTQAKWRKMKLRLAEFLTFENGHISQKNLLKIWENTQEKIEKNRENGSKGGRPKSNNTNGITKADGSVSDNPNETIPEPEPEPDTDIGGGGSACAREDVPLPSDEDMDRIFSAAKIDLTKDVTGKWHGPGPRYQAAKWVNDLGLTISEIEAVIRPIADRGGTPGSLSYFNKPMARLAGEKSASRLEAEVVPLRPQQTHRISREQMRAAMRAAWSDQA